MKTEITTLKNDIVTIKNNESEKTAEITILKNKVKEFEREQIIVKKNKFYNLINEYNRLLTIKTKYPENSNTLDSISNTRNKNSHTILPLIIGCKWNEARKNKNYDECNTIVKNNKKYLIEHYAELSLESEVKELIIKDGFDMKQLQNIETAIRLEINSI